jgi:hypothetical protein
MVAPMCPEARPSKKGPPMVPTKVAPLEEIEAD